MDALRLVPSLSPGGRLGLVASEEGVVLASDLAGRLQEAFACGNGAALLQLGGREAATALPAPLAYWRELGLLYLSAICARAGGEDRGRDPGQDPEGDPGRTLSIAAGRATRPTGPPVDDSRLLALAEAPPVMPGAEYITPELLVRFWAELDQTFHQELDAAGVPIQEFLRSLHPSWNLVGRVHFHLAENRKDAEFPFAFLATYTGRISTGARPQHQPLGQALRESALPGQRERLLSLLLPVKRAAAQCPWLLALIESGEIYHPLRWQAGEAWRLLEDLPKLERAGVVVRMPAGWTGGRPPTPRLVVSVGGRPPSSLGIDALLDFQVSVTLEGKELTPAEMEQLLADSAGLTLIRGRWVEVDSGRVARLLERYRQFQELIDEDEGGSGGLPLRKVLRLLAGADLEAELAAVPAQDGGAPDWTDVVAGPWLARTLSGLRSPEGLAPLQPGRDLKGKLRPYQEVGLRWLHLLSGLGLGACLADDMGLGKTIQVLALLLARRRAAPRGRGPSARRAPSPRPPSILVAPASLLANWAAEIERFAPSLRAVIAHSSAMPPRELKAPAPAWVEGADLIITSYASLLRLPSLAERSWDLVILDEAQAIKNPGARQTRAVKKLPGRARIVLTGTPIENRLGDLWSIFDFLNPGLLGGRKQFSSFIGRLSRRPHNPYGPLRDLVRPYILRRLKTDRSVIADLPEKTEMCAYCSLSRKQAALYQQAVADLTRELKEKEGIERRGLVLAALMRFKQICNHPSQWLGDGSWRESDSGKWGRLREIAEVIASRQEKVLVFTQFREVTGPVADFLGGVFGRAGLVLHGQTPVGRRRQLVRRFQEDESVPFFVLSLKAGGTGLNLTAASHVVHFDRWWNPAVENQATDRAFRIGQRKNVLVHKFVCRGTVEERIDELIASKRKLSRQLLESGPELLLTEMADDELLRLVTLDLRVALQE